MRILSRYFVWRFLGLFAAILFISTTAIIVVEMLLNFDDVLRTEDDALGIARYLLVRIPARYLRDLFPLATFAAAYFSLGLAAHWNELIAIKAGGISPRVAVIPILLCTIVLAFGGFVINETVGLRAAQGWSQQDPERQIAFRRGSWWYHRGRTIYNVRDADAETRTLRGVQLFERDARGRLLRSVQAPEVHVEDEHHWLLIGATVRTFDPDSLATPPRIEVGVETVIEITDRADLALDAEPATLPLHRLREFIGSRPLTDARLRRLETLLHTRLADPFAVLVFALLALPLGLRVEYTRSLGRPAVAGVATIALFFLLRNTGAALALEGVIPATVAPWASLGAFGALGLWQLARTPS